MKYFIYITLLCAYGTIHSQEPWTSGRPDGHAPISVMGDHTHHQGEWMISYRYMFMNMENMRDGTSTLSEEEVLTDYMVTPTSMPMNMHMLGMMYAASNELTLMAMGGYRSLTMDHLTRSGMVFTTKSSGISDLKIGGLYQLLDQKRQSAHINLMVSLPTGSIEERDVTPASAPDKTQLPYPMQIGSGTFDLLPGATYLCQQERSSFGLQTSAVLRLGENKRGYRFGHQWSAVAWSAYNVTRWLSASLKAKVTQTGAIDGADDAYMNPMMVSTIDPDNFGGTLGLIGSGFNIYLSSGMFKNVRLAAEVALPIYQNLNGPQMEIQQIATFGMQYSW